MKKSVKEMTSQEMVEWTIMALNCGSEEAMQCASDIKKRVEKSGDQELIQKINYLWDVI